MNEEKPTPSTPLVINLNHPYPPSPSSVHFLFPPSEKGAKLTAFIFKISLRVVTVKTNLVTFKGGVGNDVVESVTVTRWMSETGEGARGEVFFFTYTRWVRLSLAARTPKKTTKLTDNRMI